MKKSYHEKRRNEGCYQRDIDTDINEQKKTDIKAIKQMPNTEKQTQTDRHRNAQRQRPSDRHRMREEEKEREERKSSADRPCLPPRTNNLPSCQSKTLIKHRCVGWPAPPGQDSGGENHVERYRWRKTDGEEQVMEGRVEDEERVENRRKEG